MLAPKQTKHRKMQKGSQRGLSKGGQYITFGDYGMQALERGRIDARQIEACRVTLNRAFQRKGQVWVRIFPDKPISRKPEGTRMGKGKGSTDSWVATIRPGRVLFEVGSVTREVAQSALRRAAAKLGMNTRFISRLENHT